MAKFEETNPSAAFLRALQNQSWEVWRALAELVDNGFGDGHGNAPEVHLVWNPKARTIVVRDNGMGMKNVAHLFKLGTGGGRTIGDIGEFGSGGTMALIWLASRVRVWTLRASDGQVARSNLVDWDKQIEKNEYPRIDTEWYPVSRHTPETLRVIGHGTQINLEVPKGRQVNVAHIKEELGRTYGPAVRHGRKLIWHTITRQGVDEQEELADVLHIPQPQKISVSFPFNGHTLTAKGEVGIIPDLPLKHSGIAIGHPIRLIKMTKECYRSPDKKESFEGLGVAGYLDVGEEWVHPPDNRRSYLSTTKNKIDNDEAWQALMDALFWQLRPLLEEVQEEERRVVINKLQIGFAAAVNGTSEAELDVGEVRPTDEPRTHPHGPPENDGEIPKPKPVPTRDPKAPFGPTSFEVVIQPVSDKALGHELCDVEVVGNTVIAYINADHFWVKKAMEERPPNQMALHHLIVAKMSVRLLQKYPEMLQKMFPPKLVKAIDERDDDARPGYLTRLFIDRIEAPA